jgi:hypothetical protein
MTTVHIFFFFFRTVVNNHVARGDVTGQETSLPHQRMSCGGGIRDCFTVFPDASGSQVLFSSHPVCCRSASQQMCCAERPPPASYQLRRHVLPRATGQYSDCRRGLRLEFSRPLPTKTIALCLSYHRSRREYSKLWIMCRQDPLQRTNVWQGPLAANQLKRLVRP